MAPGRGNAATCSSGSLMLIALLSVAALASLAAADPSLVQGTLRVMDEIREDGNEVDVYHLDLPDGSWVHLDMDPSLKTKTDRLRTGQQVVAQVASLPTPVALPADGVATAALPRPSAFHILPGTSLQVLDIGPSTSALGADSAKPPARRLMAAPKQQSTRSSPSPTAPPTAPAPASPYPPGSNFYPRVLIVIIQNCNSEVATPADMLDVFLDTSMGVAGYLATCSNGKVSLVRKNTTAISVSMCMDLHINADTCHDYRTVADRALDVALQTRKAMRIANYRHILFVMPAYPDGCKMNTTQALPPIGRGEVGGNKTWIRADGWTRMDVIAHELQHNLNLMHAWIGDTEYGDTSCIMGMTGTGLKCPNAPHSWQLRWSSAIDDFQLSSMGVGMVRNYSLPHAVGNEKTFLRIVDTTGDVYFINYRRFTSLYEQMPAEYDGKVLVYRFNEGRDDPYPTYLNATLSAGDTWKTNTWGVRFTSLRGDSAYFASAEVSICRLGPLGNCNALGITSGAAPGQVASAKSSPKAGSDSSNGFYTGQPTRR